MRLKILYRKNLKMSPGKLAAQAVHAAIGLGVEDPLISVVVLQMSDLKYRACISELKDRPHYRVKDAGRTELEPGTESCVAFLE